MYQRINQHDFIKAFRTMDRLNTPDSDGGNFTPDACRALFDYLEDWIGEFQDGTGETYELDVIALCCEFAEYENVQEAVSEYDTSAALEDWIGGDADDMLDWLRDRTTVIEIPGTDRIIIQQF